MATITATSPNIIVQKFQALLAQDNDIPTFFNAYIALPKSDEVKVKYTYAYGILSTAAFAGSAIAFKFLQKHRDPVTATLAFTGALLALAFYVARKEVPTEQCTRMRAAFKEFCDPLIKALNDGRVAKTNLLKRPICGPGDAPNNYDSLDQLKGRVQDYTSTYNRGSGSDLGCFFNQESSDAEAVKKQVADHQNAAELANSYLNPEFQGKISKIPLDTQVQIGLSTLKQTATSFLYGYDKPANEESKDAKLYVNATLNVDKTATVEPWIKA